MSQTVRNIPRSSVRSWPTISAVVCGISLLLTCGAMAQNEQLIANTKHNLSASGPGSVKAVDEGQVCIFCHTPHGATAEAPLWNRYETTTVFEIYPASGSMQSVPDQPNGSTRICLSCHDGTAALGMVRSRDYTITFTGTAFHGGLQPGETNLGISLSDDHPVSFTPSLDDPEIQLPDAASAVQLDGNGAVQCRSCHDPHDNSFGSFLVQDNTESAICQVCHQKPDWDIAVHSHPQDPQYIQLIDQACSSCHLPHTAPEAPRLLRQFEEDMCYACHDGIQNQTWETSGATDMQPEFQKSSVHPIMVNPGVHDPGEGPQYSFPAPSVFLPEQSSGVLRHVECVDCHNPHSANEFDLPQDIAGALNNVWGVDENGQKISPSTHEYQICFKCHSDSQNLPQNQTNKRLEFLSSNPSFHPVIAPGTSPSVPGLLPPWTAQSTMNCSDCHNNNSPTGPLGPHGSNYQPLLKANFFTGFGQSESSTVYALCYSCHDRSTLFNQNISRFDEHDKHVQSERFSCENCHDAHGSADYTHLIRFNLDDPNIQPSSSGRLEYIDYGNGSGACYISCHGANHNPENY